VRLIDNIKKTLLIITLLLPSAKKQFLIPSPYQRHIPPSFFLPAIRETDQCPVKIYPRRAIHAFVFAIPTGSEIFTFKHLVPPSVIHLHLCTLYALTTNEKHVVFPVPVGRKNIGDKNHSLRTFGRKGVCTGTKGEIIEKIVCVSVRITHNKMMYIDLGKGFETSYRQILFSPDCRECIGNFCPTSGVADNSPCWIIDLRIEI